MSKDRALLCRKRKDQETGLHYNRYRYYSPYVGRFISKDPIGLLGGNNVYAYAPNPVSWIDPLGLMGIRKENYPTRVRKPKMKQLVENATDSNGITRCQKCSCDLTGQTKTVQHEPPLVETDNTLGYDTDQKTRNDLYNSTATEIHCLECQRSEGGQLSHTQTYRTDTGSNYEARKPRGKK